MKSKINLLPVIGLSVLLLSSTAAHAQLGNMLGGGGGASVDTGALVTQGNGLMGKFGSAYGNMNLALAKTLEALGHKEEADKLAAVAEFYVAGNIADEDQVKRDIEITESAQAKADEEMAKASTLTDEGKAHLASALPHYGKGVAETAGLAAEFSQWASSTASAASSLLSNPMKLISFKDEIDLLQVRIEDVAEAEDLFTKLMGDVVEPRREFIQQNALNVANLDF